MLQNIILASLALVPFYCWIGWADGVRTPKEALSIISLLAIIGMALYSYPIKPFKNKWLLAFIGWCFLTTLIGITIPIYCGNVVVQMPNFLIASKSLFYILLATISIVCLSSIPLDLNKISKVINYTTILLSLYGVMQLFGCDEFFRVADNFTGWVGKSIWEGTKDQIGHTAHRIVATLGNPSIFGIFLAMCLPFSFYRFKNEGKYALILSIFIILLTQSTTAIVCMVVASITYLFFTNRKLAIILAIASILIGSAGLYKFHSYLNPTGRIEVLKESWKVLEKKPLTGMGLGSFEHLIGGDPNVIKRLKNQNWLEMHNEPGQIWFETGLIGLILACLIVWSTLKRFLRHITRESVTLVSSVMAILLASVVYFPFRVGPLALYSVLIYGFLENKIGE